MARGTPVRPLFELARGGMGSVFLAVREDGRFRRLCVIKRLLPELRGDFAIRDMFLEEARVAGHLRHPNVVGVLDVGSDRDGPFLVMEYVDGMTARDLLVRTHAPLPMQVALEIGVGVASGLAAAHEAKDERGTPLSIVHRDVSPQNILLGFDGVPRLGDFGIARAAGRTTETSTGILKGNIGYMAPELLRFEPPTFASDLFSFGVVLYELLTGTRLYPKGNGGTEGLKRILEEPPPDLLDAVPTAPASLVELGFELLAKAPEDRPTSAREVAARLEAILLAVRQDEQPVSLADFNSAAEATEDGERRQRIHAALERSTRQKTGWQLSLLAAMAATTLLAGGWIAWAHFGAKRTAPETPGTPALLPASQTALQRPVAEVEAPSLAPASLDPDRNETDAGDEAEASGGQKRAVLPERAVVFRPPRPPNRRSPRVAARRGRDNGASRGESDRSRRANGTMRTLGTPENGGRVPVWQWEGP